MNGKKYKQLIEAYQNVYEQKIGVKLDEPTDAAAVKKLREILPPSEKDKIYIPKSALQKASYEYEDLYDEVLDYLINEGCTLEESNYIMTYIVEQGMPPQEIMARGVAHLLGFDKPHPSVVFAQGLRKMLYPNKPVPLKAPKPVNKVPKLAGSKPNPYRPGATIRATGPNLDKFPELQRFANQGRKIAEPVVKTAGALSALRNITPAGVAAAVMAPTPVGDATLTAAKKRGDVAPPATKLPPPESSKETVKTSTKPPVLTAKPKVSKPASTKSDKPRDPDVQKYNELRKSDPIKAKELGMKIWARKYRPAMEPPDIA